MEDGGEREKDSSTWGCQYYILSFFHSFCFHSCLQCLGCFFSIHLERNAPSQPASQPASNPKPDCTTLPPSQRGRSQFLSLQNWVYNTLQPATMCVRGLSVLPVSRCLLQIWCLYYWLRDIRGKIGAHIYHPKSGQGEHLLIPAGFNIDIISFSHFSHTSAESLLDVVVVIPCVFFYVNIFFLVL